jgi:hypothetical protein
MALFYHAPKISSYCTYRRTSPRALAWHITGSTRIGPLHLSLGDYAADPNGVFLLLGLKE